jgi:type IV secretion system protein TrbL
VFEQISQISPGPVEFFANIAEVVLLFTAGLIIIAAFFVMAIQLFVLIVEFKFTTLAGFALVPFAFWRQTSFLAERVLGNVMASGVKILVVAMIIGIGSNLFEQIRTALPDDGMNIAQAFSVVLGALVLMGLSIFCPRLAVGLVSGAPQLSAGAAAGTAIGVGAAGVAGAMAGAGAVRAGVAGTRAAASASGAVATAAKLGSLRTGMKGPAAAPINAAVGLGGAALSGARDLGARIAGHYQARAQAGSGAVFGASGGSTTRPRPATADAPAGQPDWARSFRRSQALREGATLTAHTLQSGDAGGGSEGPNLKERS